MSGRMGGWFKRCSPEQDDCCEWVCDVFSLTCVIPCQFDTECFDRHLMVRYRRDLVCFEDGVCDFIHCASDADCPEELVCNEGDCITIQ